MLKTMKLSLALAVCLTTTFLTACASGSSQRTYPAHSVGSALNVHRGEVLSISQITVEGTHDQLGTLGGGGVGYSVGRSIGHGSGARIAGAVGAVGGAVAGRAIQKKVTEKTAFELIVELDSGRTVAIVQTDLDSLTEGDQVRVLMGRGNNRVVPL